MTLALRLLQQLWPTDFAFWPESWVLPDDLGQLQIWMQGYKEEHGHAASVIVKPAAGSLGEGIFIWCAESQ